jgi:hypothetical protein
MKKAKDSEKDLQKFADSLKKKTLEELEQLEKEIIAEADKNGEDLGKMEFDMPRENYEVVAENIRKFLNKQSVQWQYTLGLVSMYDFWDPQNYKGKIPYPYLDSILRTLGGLNYTGYDEWAAVVAINKFFEPLHKAYMEATNTTYEIAGRHDAVMKEMEAKTPIGNKAAN